MQVIVYCYGNAVTKVTQSHRIAAMRHMHLVYALISKCHNLRLPGSEGRITVRVSVRFIPYIGNPGLPSKDIKIRRKT